MNRQIPEQWKKLSRGVLKNTTDAVLFLLAFGIGIAGSGRTTTGVYEAARWAEGINVDRIRRALAHMKSKGWIKGNLMVTKEGQQRINTFVPEVRQYPKRWEGVWYLVSFDIPERLAWKRNNFRTALVCMGFGKLHASLWISPYNFLGDVGEYCKRECLARYVMLATSEKLGTRQSCELADQVWRLEELNAGYCEWIESYSKDNTDPTVQFKHIFEYCALLRRDSFLHTALLPSPWHGERAHKLFQTIAPLQVKVDGPC